MLDANIHRITIIVAERSLSGKSAGRGSFDSAGISPAIARKSRHNTGFDA